MFSSITKIIKEANKKQQLLLRNLNGKKITDDLSLYLKHLLVARYRPTV